jgi:O-antigen/teichoic acid export membrane protein
MAARASRIRRRVCRQSLTRSRLERPADPRIYHTKSPRHFGECDSLRTLPLDASRTKSENEYMTFHGQEGKSLLAKNSFFNLLGQVLPMLVGIVTIPYIIRGLGVNGYGILSIAFMVLGYFSIFDLGLSRATVKFVAQNLSPDKIHKVPELVWTSLGLLVGLGCAGGILAAAFVPLAVTHFLKMPASFVGEARASLFVLCASMPVMLGNDALRGVLEATQRFDLVNYVKVPGSICFYLFAALAIPLGVKVSGIVLILVLVRLTTAALYLALCFRALPNLRGNFRFSREAIRPLASFGGWIMVSNITGPIGGNIERFLIASGLSVGMLTYYSVPFDLVGKIAIFPASIAPALFPYFSYHGEGKGNEVKDVTSRSIKYLLLVMAPVTAVFIFFAKDILQLWVGPQFAAQSTVVMQLVAILFFFNCFAYIPFTSVQALGRPELKAILDLVALPIYAVGCWWLMHRMGVNGAALAKLLVTVLDCTVLYIFAWRMKAFHVRDLMSGPLSRALVASAGLFAAVYFIHSLRVNLLLSSLLLIVCFCVYGVAFWSAAVDLEDRGTLMGFWRKAIFLIKREQPTPTPLIEVGSE